MDQTLRRVPRNPVLHLCRTKTPIRRRRRTQSCDRVPLQGLDELRGRERPWGRRQAEERRAGEEGPVPNLFSRDDGE